MRASSLAFRPVVEIDLDAAVKNYRFIAETAGAAETAAVVKCNAYGLGAAALGSALAGAGCRSFFVAYPDEGAALRPLLGDAEIYVFNGPDEGDIDVFVESQLIPVLNTHDQAALWARRGRGAAALHIDTGINRLGAPESELDAIAALKLDLRVVMSHLSCSSDPGDPENARQWARFSAAAGRFPEARTSLSASAGALLGPDYRFDMVRVGAAIYGVSPFDRPDARLAPVARLTAPVAQLRDVAAGEGVGYNHRAILTRPSRLATLFLGYGDGLHRAAFGRGQVFLGGALCPMIGRVSMDLIVIDVTDAGPVAIGDRAEIFGAKLPIEDAAATMGTLGYELLTSLGPRVARRYLRNGEDVTAPTKIDGAVL